MKALFHFYIYQPLKCPHCTWCPQMSRLFAQNYSAPTHSMAASHWLLWKRVEQDTNQSFKWDRFPGTIRREKRRLKGKNTCMSAQLLLPFLPSYFHSFIPSFIPSFPINWWFHLSNIRSAHYLFGNLLASGRKQISEEERPFLQDCFSFTLEINRTHWGLGICLF